MKVLSLSQPFATLVMLYEKRFETRGWPTRYRGPVAIHAALGFPAEFRRLCACEPFRSVLLGAGLGGDVPLFARPGNLDEGHACLPRGVILCVVDFAGCVQTSVVRDMRAGTAGMVAMPPSDRWGVNGVVAAPHEYDFGDYSDGEKGRGRYAFATRNLRVLRRPVEHRGALGLRDLPPDVEARVVAQLEKPPVLIDKVQEMPAVRFSVPRFVLRLRPDGRTPEPGEILEHEGRRFVVRGAPKEEMGLAWVEADETPAEKSP